MAAVSRSARTARGCAAELRRTRTGLLVSPPSLKLPAASVRLDLRDAELVDGKKRLARLLARSRAAIQFSEHLEHDGATVFDHARRLGLEGIVSKRIDSTYRIGPSKTWLKSKNPLSEAVRREHDEDWG
jgi:hypothetical protein